MPCLDPLNYLIQSFSGIPYGSYIAPQHTGSSGGGSQPGTGGGIVTIEVNRFLHLDGVVKSDGGNASGDNSGGGSAGSIYISTQNVSGHGLFSTTGGNGYGIGYGGAGGRIAVHVKWFREYSGEYQAFGGFAGSSRSSSDDTRHGAGGTVFATDSNELGLDKKEVLIVNGKTVVKDGFTWLYLDNDNRNLELGTVVMADDGADWHSFEFDQVEAINGVVLWLDGDSSTLDVKEFDGDKTGKMHLRGHQKMFVEYEPAKTGYTVAPVSYDIEEGTEIILPSTTHMLGTKTELKGLMTNVQNLTIAEGSWTVFTSTAQTALIEAEVYVHETSPGNISVTCLTIQRGSKATFTDVADNLVLTLTKLRIQYQGLMMMNKGTIYSDSGVVESEGVLNADFMGHVNEAGVGKGNSSGVYGYGAAHGGHGGAPEPDVGGTPYDSVYRPTERGSGGGNGNGEGGRGGGYLLWINGKTLWIDGEVTVEGEAGRSGNAGGGSGGGILIETLNFTGYGHVDAHGGAGIGHGGGGSGGRIAIHINFDNRYVGRLNVVGGIGTGDLPSGAAGTVYIQENERGPQYAQVKYNSDGTKTIKPQHSRLEVDNDDIDQDLYVGHKEPWLYTMLDEGSKEFYEFDEAELRGHANLMIEYPDGSGSNDVAVTVQIHLFQGDRTGVVRVRDRQELYVEVVESVSNETVAPCSFRIDNGSEVFFPSVVNLLGTRTVLAGQITGVEEMMIRGGSDVIFMSTATTALIENRKYTMVTEPGNFTFSILRVMAYSKAEFRDIGIPMSLTVAEFYVKYEGLLLMNFVLINSTYAHLESGGELNMDGIAFGPEEGPGNGTTLGDGTGLGAGHGGYGGGPGPATGGVPYNTIYAPEEAGSGGGNGGGIGGSGGGFIDWNAADLIELNGLLTLKGTDGQGGNAGGGSGGSVLIDTTNMTGHGIIAVNGGNGVNNGGGGSGGRISLRCRWRYQYGGEFHNFGGDGDGSNTQTHSGASGTTYKEENLRELEYRLKKYDPVHNTTFLAVDHTYLHSDNWGKYSPQPTLLQDPPRENYEFDEVELTGSTYLWIYHPKNVDLVSVTIHKFIGDKTGQLHVREKQQVFVEYVESETNKTEAPCSFIIDEDAEIVFPSEVHIHGTNSTFGGLITGVIELFIENETVAEFLSTGNTALIENQQYVNKKPKGSYAFGQLHVKRGGMAGFLQIKKKFSLETSEINVKYQGNMYMNNAEITCTYAWLESEGVLHLNGKGYGPENGTSPGQTYGIEGYGAGHGGYGGGANLTQVADPYGSIFSPIEAGSGGGNGDGVGGSGGGILHWNISHYLELHGYLALQGTDGTDGNAGGGSGGSLLIHTMNFTGHGEINVEGGLGDRLGGGGAGGRIGVHCEWRYSFGGTYVNNGGQGGALYEDSHAGAAGTTFVKNNNRPLEYRILKYRHENNDTIKYFEVDHRYLLVHLILSEITFLIYIVF